MARRRDPLFALVELLARLLKGKKQGWRICLLSLLVVLVLFRLYSQGYFISGTADGEKIEGIVVHVADGDTLTVRSGTFGNFKKEKVRLYGIDAPEMNQMYGPESKEWLLSRVMGQPVTVEKENVDQYGRLVGRVYAKEKYINMEAVQAGMAWYYKQYAKGEGDLFRAEEKARRARAGLWQQERPQAPWEYRKRHRN